MHTEYCGICNCKISDEPCGCTEQDHINALRKELQGIRELFTGKEQELADAIKARDMAIKEVGEWARKHGELLALVEKMVELRKKLKVVLVNGLKYEPHLMCKVDDMWKEAETFIKKAKGE